MCWFSALSQTCVRIIMLFSHDIVWNFVSLSVMFVNYDCKFGFLTLWSVIKLISTYNILLNHLWTRLIYYAHINNILPKITSFDLSLSSIFFPGLTTNTHPNSIRLIHLKFYTKVIVMLHIRYINLLCTIWLLSETSVSTPTEDRLILQISTRQETMPQTTQLSTPQKPSL